MGRLKRVQGVVIACLGISSGLSAQDTVPPRRLTVAQTGCDSALPAASDSVYEADAVDRPVRAPYLRVTGIPYHMRDVINGRTMLRFIVEPSGWIDRCSIVLVEESSAEWTDAVLAELRHARYEPARKGGTRVRQVVYQVFTYHSDGRLDVSQ
jgi:hypothetical protein